MTMRAAPPSWLPPSVCAAALAVLLAGCGQDDAAGPRPTGPADPAAVPAAAGSAPDASAALAAPVVAPAAAVPAPVAAVTNAPAAPVPPAGTSTAGLSGPYEDPGQADVDFGRRSWFMSPWRAYMDTQPARQFLNCVGITLTGDGPDEIAAETQMLSEAGFTHARVEWGWGGLDFSSGHFHEEGAWSATLAGLKQHGIRPLILLNGHQGQPCPVRFHDVTVAVAAAAGAREIVLADVSQIRPGYTGFRDQGDYVAGYPLIDAVDAASGRCTLSSPLMKPVAAGHLQLVELKFRPFSGAVFADGSPNPAAAETVQGWMDYVAAVTATAKAALGTEGAPDAGFDLEVWNEYSFGSAFLDVGNYCSPKPAFKEPFTYTCFQGPAAGHSAKGVEAILPMTVDWVGDPAHHCPGVKVISGFANQRPWDSGSDMWPGQAGISRHYYAGLDHKIIDASHISSPNVGPLDAFGKPDGTPDHKDWCTVAPGSFYVPEHRVAMPEYWFFAYITEFITRDIQPFPSARGGPVPFDRHFRYGQPGTGRPAEVWESETNTERSAFARQVLTDAKAGDQDPRLSPLLQAMGARTILRQFVFSAHKGVTTITMFASKNNDRELGVIADGFFAALKHDGGQLTPRVRAAVGDQVPAVGRVVRLLRSGEDIDVPRKLTLDQLVEHDPVLVFHGDGTPGHPDRWQRDDFACLPFQLAADRFTIGFYVVTRDMAVVRDAAKDPFDINRYAMAPQTYDLTLGNLRGTGATVTAYDPITDRVAPVAVIGGTATTLTVRVQATDYPRFLTITEAAPGPLASGVHLGHAADGSAEVVFTGNVPGTATVTWGAWPQRSGGKAELAVAPGGEIHVTLNDAAATDAVQITYRADGLEARWPQWPHDVRGRFGFGAGAGAGADAGAIAAQTPAALPALTAPASADTAYAAGAPWSGAAPRHTASLPGGIEVVLERIPGKPADAMPPVSNLDHREAVAASWGGAPAWTVSDVLDPVAHPGERQLARSMRLRPLGDGTLVLIARGPDAATLQKSAAAIDGLLAAVTFSH